MPPHEAPQKNTHGWQPFARPAYHRSLTFISSALYFCTIRQQGSCTGACLPADPAVPPDKYLAENENDNPQEQENSHCFREIIIQETVLISQVRKIHQGISRTTLCQTVDDRELTERDHQAEYDCYNQYRCKHGQRELTECHPPRRPIHFDGFVGLAGQRVQARVGEDDNEWSVEPEIYEDDR